MESKKYQAMNDADPLVGISPKSALGHMDALPAGTRLGEFELQGLLGVGGFGMVYRGYDHSLHRPVAIKEFMPAAMVGRAPDLQVSVRADNDANAFQAGLKSFIAEARLLAKFDHPSLVKVYRFWEANHTAYMAMPLYSGITLKQARSQMSGPPPEAWLRTVLWSILEALKVLHAHNTLHRDVSPDNIFLQDVGPPVLLDLGAARRTIRDVSHKHTAVLKVNYAPIEQYADAQDLSEGPWTDIYSLAAVIHMCLCNEAPLPATFRVVRDRMPSFAKVAKTVEEHFGTVYSSGFISAMDHALAIQPAQRPQTVEAFSAQMRLRAPEGMTRFEWRLQLGDKVSLNDRHLAPVQEALQPNEGPQGAVPAVTASFEDTVMNTPLLADVTQNNSIHASSTGAAVSPFARMSAMWWFGLILLVVIGVLGYRLAQNGLKQPAVASAPAPSQPIPVKPEQPTKAASAANGASPSKPAKSSFAKPAAPAPANTVVSSSGEICANENFFTRPSCLQRECKLPANAQTTLCIETLERWERNRTELRQ